MQTTIAIIFDYEGDFKYKVLDRHGWKHDEYKIERCHSALHYRITLRHYDGREKELYINSFDVYSWLEDLGILER